MRLLVDIGNSSLKWAWQEPAGPGRMEAGMHRGRSFSGWLDECWGALPAPEELVLASVAPETVNVQCREWVARHWAGAALRWVRPRARGFGVEVVYPEPARLGVDRWCALIGARRRCPEPLCIVDCGTAVTIDALDGGGRHLGGLIAPGVEMMRAALLSATGRIGAGDGDGDLLFGHDTGPAVASGTRHAAAGFVSRVVARMRGVLGGGAPCLVTGGDAQTLLPEIAAPAVHVPALVLEGLAVCAEVPA